MSWKDIKNNSWLISKWQDDISEKFSVNHWKMDKIEKIKVQHWDSTISSWQSNIKKFSIDLSNKKWKLQKRAEKKTYNEGRHISSRDNPVWSMHPLSSGSLPSPIHQPCGYWCYHPAHLDKFFGHSDIVSRSLGVWAWETKSPVVVFVDIDNQWRTGVDTRFYLISPSTEARIFDWPTARTYTSGGFLMIEDGEVKLVKIAEGDFNGSQPLDDIEIVLFNSDGSYNRTLYQLMDTGIEPYCQACNINPNDGRLWFSYTNDYLEGAFKSVKFDGSDLNSEVALPLNWSIEWDNDGLSFISGIYSPDDYDTLYHTIYYLRNGSQLDRLININGFSTGFAFDDFNNLWCGTYSTSGPDNQQYLLVYKASTIQSAISGPSTTLLNISDADKSYSLPQYNGRYIGICEIIYRSSSIYLSANGGYSSTQNIEKGCVLKIPTHLGDASDPFASSSKLEVISDGPETTDWDWVKCIF